MIPIVLLVTALFRPAHPTVGDLVTVQFSERVIVDKSPSYEVVSQSGNTVVIRAFRPEPFSISGKANGIEVRDIVVPMQSVLKLNDDLAPAPLKPPRRESFPRLPFIAITIAAIAAIAAWTAAALRRDEAAQPAIPMLPPDDVYRAAVLALRDNPRAPQRWSRLADALRDYLAATTDIGRELTTREVLDARRDPAISDILRHGDLEKFSPWGPAALDFEDVANRALALVPEKIEEIAA